MIENTSGQKRQGVVIIERGRWITNNIRNGAELATRKKNVRVVDKFNDRHDHLC